MIAVIAQAYLTMVTVIVATSCQHECESSVMLIPEIIDTFSDSPSTNLVDGDYNTIWEGSSGSVTYHFSSDVIVEEVSVRSNDYRLSSYRVKFRGAHFSWEHYEEFLTFSSLRPYQSSHTLYLPNVYVSSDYDVKFLFTYHFDSVQLIFAELRGCYVTTPTPTMLATTPTNFTQSATCPPSGFHGKSELLLVVCLIISCLGMFTFAAMCMFQRCKLQEATNTAEANAPAELQMVPNNEEDIYDDEGQRQTVQ
jgi:hypothetical protein